MSCLLHSVLTHCICPEHFSQHMSDLVSNGKLIQQGNLWQKFSLSPWRWNGDGWQGRVVMRVSLHKPGKPLKEWQRLWLEREARYQKQSDVIRVVSWEMLGKWLLQTRKELRVACAVLLNALLCPRHVSQWHIHIMLAAHRASVMPADTFLELGDVQLFLLDSCFLWRKYSEVLD